MEETPQPTSEKRILVVEDDYLAVTELVAKLIKLGYKAVGPVASLDDAFSILEEFSDISGAILDINLGGKMVFPVADELGRLNIPYIFATGYSREVIPPRYAERIFLGKPFEISSLNRALSEMQRAVRRALVVPRNLILAALPRPEADLLRPWLSTIQLKQGRVLEERQGEIHSLYFVDSGLLSMIVRTSSGLQLEAGVIGREGVTGCGLLDGDLQSPYDLVVQVEGSAQVLDVDAFLRVIGKTPKLRSLISAFSRTLTVQVSYTALANGRCKIEQRLARWLLMVGDRTGSSVIHLTHKYMAIMLGVRRSGVTGALHILEGDGLIRSVRGKAIIVDRKGLIERARGAYGPPEAEYHRLMGFKFEADEIASRGLLPFQGGAAESTSAVRL